MREPTPEEVRRARDTFVRELNDLRHIINVKIARAQRSAPGPARKYLCEVRVAIAQLVERVSGEYQLLEALDDADRALKHEVN
jgi:hypothetical protein